MKKILTLIIDGLGESDNEVGNAIKMANMPNYSSLLEKYPHAHLEASGPSVGLPEGQCGNEILGYKTISAGQILKQRSSFVREFVEKDNLATNSAIKNIVEHVSKHNSTLHVVGLMSDAGIYSNIDDTIDMLNFFKEQNIKVVVDFISDGRDVEAKSAIKYIEMIEKTGTKIVSVCGRYYAMNDSGKWDRTKIYYDLIRNGVGLKVKELRLALKNCYIRDITDEFLPPIIVEPDYNIKDNDAVLWINYHEEGSTQILTTLTNPQSQTEIQAKPLINTKFWLMYPVDPTINATVLINEEDDATNSLGIYLSKLDLSQARISGPSSYEYITYFFNNETRKKLPKCNNYLIDVSKIDTDRESELSMAGVTKQIIKCMEKDTDYILATLDGAELVAKSGDYEKTIKMLEFTDLCLGKILESAELNFYNLIILSTHGHLEELLNEEGKILTTNSCNKVPFIITDTKLELQDGSLTGVAPTILKFMDISIPDSMKNSKILIKE